MAGFITPLDIANRACQHCGMPRITALTESTRQASETNYAIDKVRRAELRRSVWTFAVRRAVLRPIVSTTQLISFATYNVATTYAAGDIVADTSFFLWLSVSGANLANTPGAGGLNTPWVAYFGPRVAQVWDTAISYFPGDMVVVSSVIYICVLAHSAHTPPNATYWHVVVGATGAVPAQLAPLGVNPPTGASTRNLYRLPCNYIRIAEQDPKAAAISRLGTTAGMSFNDWEIEAGYIFTADSSPIILRFVADQTDVTLMDDLFCEAWAARLAMEVCETLTQSSAKAADIKGEYTNYLTTAKAISAIESGSTEPEIPEGAIAGQPAQRGQ